MVQELFSPLGGSTPSNNRTIFGIVSIIASSGLGVFYKTMLAHNSPRGVILGSAFCSVFKVHRPPHFSHVLGNYAGNVWPSGFGRTNCSDRKPMF